PAVCPPSGRPHLGFWFYAMTEADRDDAPWGQFPSVILRSFTRRGSSFAFIISCNRSIPTPIEGPHAQWLWLKRTIVQWRRWCTTRGAQACSAAMARRKATLRGVTLGSGGLRDS